MSGSMYLGVDGVARKVKQAYIGVNGVARKVKKGYVGVDNVARQFLSSGLGGLAVGETVYLNVSGAAKPFIIVHQGTPNSEYYSNCDGTWLLSASIAPKSSKYYSGDSNDEKVARTYINSDVNRYLNESGEYMSLLDADIASIIKSYERWIPYYDVESNAIKTISIKGCFALSPVELGVTSTTYIRRDGSSTLDYFSLTESAAERRNIGFDYWTRTPTYAISDPSGVETFVNIVNSVGNISHEPYTDSMYLRPALILPSNTLVDENFNIIA